jgi:hypothetical protein
MDHLDPHLEILLHEFTRVCPESALKQEDWAGLYEICLYAHEQDVAPPASSIKDYLITHRCSLQKATFLSHQYGHLINILKLRDQRKNQLPKH